MIGRVRLVRSGFTLLEAVLVLAVIGLIGSLVLVGTGRDGQARLEREVVREIERSLLMARVEAMREGEGREVRIVFAGGEVEIGASGRVRRLADKGLGAVDERGLAAGELLVRFGSDGRTRERLLRIVSEGADVQRAFDLGLLDDSATTVGDLMSGERSNRSGAEGIGGRLWLVRLDPVSGAASVDAVGWR